jgi:hypothetical protein
MARVNKVQGHLIPQTLVSFYLFLLGLKLSLALGFKRCKLISFPQQARFWCVHHKMLASSTTATLQAKWVSFRTKNTTVCHGGDKQFEELQRRSVYSVK